MGRGEGGGRNGKGGTTGVGKFQPLHFNFFFFHFSP